MSIYRLNTSFMVEPPVHAQWLRLVEKYREMLRERGFGEHTLSRVLSAQTENHFTYSLLVEIDTMERYKELTEEVFPEYTAIAVPLLGTKVVWFNTLMKIIE